jgi:hypothetical protein
LVEALAAEYGRRLTLDERDTLWRVVEVAAPRALAAYLRATEVAP